MCLGEVVQVREVRADGRALVLGTRQVQVSLLLLDGPVIPGDWLLVHSGIALSRMDPEEADAALALRSEVTTGAPTRHPSPPTTRTGGPT